ncbi:MAG: aminopeptidase [Thermodesulfobacteriota bacterium]|nr:aminopeptidase [Thermodesulfobacteriota bacterium]
MALLRSIDLNLKSLTSLIFLLTTVPLTGCSDLGYYYQCAQGHIKVMSNARPIIEVIKDPQTEPETRQNLEKVLLMRNFAVTELGLPENDSYRSYADIGRPYVVWNVVATTEFSLEPKQWCFPVAGCVSYKGYFKQAKAEKLAATMRRKNYDVDLYGVQAYSTLNWFDDPLLNTYLNSSDTRLAGLLFHELAHQLIYIADDSSFNEAFAMTVQIEGVRRWFQQTANQEDWQRFLDHQKQGEVFHHYLHTTREKLKHLYRRNLPLEQMRTDKKKLISKALDRFEQLKATGQLDQRFDRWMLHGINNARLAGIATYRELIPGFQIMLKQCQGDLGCFYDEVRILSKLQKNERLARLKDVSNLKLAMQSGS